MKSLIVHGIHLYHPDNMLEKRIVREMIRLLVDLRAGQAVFNVWDTDNAVDGPWFPASTCIPGEKAVIATIDLGLPTRFHEQGSLECRMNPKCENANEVYDVLRERVLDADVKNVNERMLLHYLVQERQLRRRRPVRGIE